MRTCVMFLGIFICFFLHTVSSSAQITYQYDDKNGMPSSWGCASTQNTDDLIYLATDNGLGIFNGFDFNVVSTINRDIINCFRDSEGRIWFINSSAQLFFYDKGVAYSHEQIDAISEIHSSLISRDLSFNDKLIIDDGNGIAEIFEEYIRSVALNNIRNRIQTLNMAGDFKITFDMYSGSKYFEREFCVEASLEIEYINL